MGRDKGWLIYRTIFFDWNLNADKYLIMLQEDIFPSLLYEDGNFQICFQQDGAPSHFGIRIRQCRSAVSRCVDWSAWSC